MRRALDPAIGPWYVGTMPDTTPDPITTAGWLRRWREESGMSQAQVAERLGILQSTVSRWERGHPVALADLRLLVRIYGVPVDEAGRCTFAPDQQVEAA